MIVHIHLLWVVQVYNFPEYKLCLYSRIFEERDPVLHCILTCSFKQIKYKYIEWVWTEKFGLRGQEIINWEKTKNIFSFFWKSLFFWVDDGNYQKFGSKQWCRFKNHIVSEREELGLSSHTFISNFPFFEEKWLFLGKVALKPV